MKNKSYVFLTLGMTLKKKQKGIVESNISINRSEDCEKSDEEFFYNKKMRK